MSQDEDMAPRASAGGVLLCSVAALQAPVVTSGCDTLPVWRRQGFYSDSQNRV